MVEVAQVREFVTQRVDQARVFERFARHRVGQADADGAVVVADAIATPDVGAFRLDRVVAKPEGLGDPTAVAIQLSDQVATRFAVQTTPGIPSRISARPRCVKYPLSVGPEATATRIPIFPLSMPVLFPDSAVPLHIFEPRYRQMTAEALDGEGVIGMVTVRPSATEGMAGDPPVFEIGCAGRIAEHRKLPDGRYEMLLRATARFRVVAEVPREGERLYRVADTEALDEPMGDEVRAETVRARVIEHLRVIANRGASASNEAMDLDGLARLELARFTNGVCQALALPPQEKQGLLEAPTLEERLIRLDGALAFHLAASGVPDPSTVH